MEGRLLGFICMHHKDTITIFFTISFSSSVISPISISFPKVNWSKTQEGKYSIPRATPIEISYIFLQLKEVLLSFENIYFSRDPLAMNSYTRARLDLSAQNPIN
ncbi:hypothetical protein QQP08_017592 [Theobroma cacao]|nr:hypothetical protein QQP08_017592 [Theobroma cacao]